nr:MAG TPA: hypothetical protein [Caudoviricetes sp.]
MASLYMLFIGLLDLYHTLVSHKYHFSVKYGK